MMRLMSMAMRLMVLMCLSATAARAQAPAAKGPEGIWLGTLEAGVAKLRIAFHVKRGADAGLSTTMDSLDQGANGLPVEKTTWTAPTLRFDAPKLGISFEGKIDGDLLSGTFTQGKAFPMSLRRVERLDAPKRPQEPKRPYPYREEEISLVVPERPREAARGVAGIKLAGTLTLPTGKGPFPAVLLVTGSGPEDRDETVFDHKPFLVLADALTRAGIATLRFDDRGTGKSESSNKGLTTLDLAEDTRLEVEYLASRPDIDKRALGIIGHSEGGLIAPIVATQSKLVRLVVMLAGTGMTGDKVLVDQNELIARAMGSPAARLGQDRKDFTALYATLRSTTTDEDADRAIAAFVDGDPMRKSHRDGLAKLARDPWFRMFLSLDPVPYLKRVAVPVLAIAGEKDLQVPPTNLPLVENALRRGKCPDVTVKLLPTLNHLFQHAKNGSPSEYAASEETFAPEALKLVTDWVIERASRARR